MKDNPTIYFYKMTVDNGGAPYASEKLLSLAICKPMIRSTARERNWIFGFGGKNYGEKLVYVAIVTERLENGK